MRLLATALYSEQKKMYRDQVTCGEEEVVLTAIRFYETNEWSQQLLNISEPRNWRTIITLKVGGLSPQICPTFEWLYI